MHRTRTPDMAGYFRSWWVLSDRGWEAITEPHDPRDRPPTAGQISDEDWQKAALARYVHGHYPGWDPK